MWLCQSILFQHQLQKENGDHTFRLSGTAYITSSLLYNKVTDTNASALLRNFTYNQSIKRTIIFFRRRDRYEKMKKILISLITVFVLAILPAESAILPGTVCVTEAAPRISSSKLTMIKGQSRTLKITGLKKGQKITWKSSSPKLVTVSASGKLSAIRNESSNLSFHFQKLTDPYEILTQKDASELANDTLDMAVPYWADLLKGSGITLRSLGFSTTK